MNRREILTNTGTGLVALIGAGSVTAASDPGTTASCGECQEEDCYCDGEWYDCTWRDEPCCDGSIECTCIPTCAPGCPACP